VVNWTSKVCDSKYVVLLYPSRIGDVVTRMRFAIFTIKPAFTRAKKIGKLMVKRVGDGQN